ncbi:MAG: CCA tRNA nucleotidyltransferase [Candidatus Rokubacteria bacterium]|nr:CCA tRNA nucleotidyltransferase [Candidatus Rokubacteria bacterium]
MTRRATLPRTKPRRPRATYPQVDVGAAALVDAAVLAVPASISVADALAKARRRDVHVLVAADALILRDDLARAASLGIGGARARMLARPIPLVDADASEVVVRRHLGAGAPLVAVRDGRRVIGAISAGTAAGDGGISLTDRLGRRLPAAALNVLDTAARVAAERGARAYLAGGIVRDALADRLGHGGPATHRPAFGGTDPQSPTASPDLDVVVEGDGPGVARALADALVAPLVEHARFLTATVGPTSAGRIDVATARSERYEGRGTLPRVMPSSIEQDLRRRDFTVNAMAVELASGRLELLDPHGGRSDLATRTLRILHPASFVEDPTRMFRAARYAVRLGLGPDAWTTRCQERALSLAPYPALSGARLLGELTRILAEPRPDLVLVRLGAGGVYRLLDPRYRFGRAARARLSALPGALAQGGGVGPSGSKGFATELLLVALLAGQPGEVIAAALRRLDVTGEPLARITRAIAERASLARVLASPARISERARAVRGRPTLHLAAVWLDAPAEVRRQLDAVRDALPVRATLRGDEVIGLGVPAGPAVAAVLEALRDAQLDGEVTGRSEEEAFVRTWAEHTRKER